MSDDKKLLSENTVRRFMKLANVSALSGNFIQENFNEEEANEEEINEEEAIHEFIGMSCEMFMLLEISALKCCVIAWYVPRAGNRRRGASVTASACTRREGWRWLECSWGWTASYSTGGFSFLACKSSTILFATSFETSIVASTLIDRSCSTPIAFIN